MCMCVHMCVHISVSMSIYELCMSMFECACEYMCVCVCVLVLVCVYVCVCPAVGVRILSHSSFYSLKQGLSVTDMLVSLASLFWGLQLYLLRLELQAAAMSTWHLSELGGSELWSLGLYSKCSNH